MYISVSVVDRDACVFLLNNLHHMVSNLHGVVPALLRPFFHFH